MKPVTVSVTVPNPRDEVYAFLDVLANHEQFTDHFLVDWEPSGPRTGVGAAARMQAKAFGKVDEIDMQVVEADPPYRSVEESVGAAGKRRTRGTYRLEERSDGGTTITFEFRWLEAPASERLMAPMTRSLIRRGNARAMQRLAALLANGS